MIASQMCSRLKNKIEKKEIKYGYIHSVFNKACNIITNNNELITLLLSEDNIGPMTISINLTGSFLKLGLEKGKKIIFRQNYILLTDNINFTIDLSQVRLWNPSPVFNYKRANQYNLSSKIQKLGDIIYKYGKKEGIGDLVYGIKDSIDNLDEIDKNDILLSSNNSFIINNFINFLKDFSNKNLSYIEKSALGIIGFGPGLTPSMDDFVVGLMISLIYLYDFFSLDIKQAYEINEKITHSIKNKTTIVSEWMLKYASNGFVMNSLKELMISLVSDLSEEHMTKKIFDVLKFGSTSGTDMLCGVYIGSKIIINQNNRGLFSNDSER